MECAEGEERSTTRKRRKRRLRLGHIAICLVCGALMVFIALGVAALLRQSPDRRGELEKTISGIPHVEPSGPPQLWPDGKYDAMMDADDEFRLKMILLISKRSVNTNNVTAGDLDLTGWQEASGKSPNGGVHVLEAFLESAWEKANAKKLNQ